MSAEMTFQVARERATSRTSQSACSAPEDLGALRLQARGVGVLEGAHVEAEDVEQGPALDLAVDPGRGEPVPAGVRAGVGDRHVLLPGLPGACGEHVDAALLGVARVGEHLAGPPVVGRLVVVPLRDDRHLGVHRPHVVVEQRVAVPTPELRQGLRHLGHLRRHQVAPHLAVRLGHLGGDRPVRIDRVAGVHEEVGPGLVHGAVADQPAQVGVDPPALAAGVSGPHEARGGGLHRGGPEAQRARLADVTVLVLEGQLDGVVAPGR